MGHPSGSIRVKGLGYAADGVMSLYEDDGISFGYLKGQFSDILCTWHDQERRLTLKAESRGKPARHEAMVIEIAGEPESKPLIMRGGAASVRL